MKLTGHATRDVFRRYNILTDADVRPGLTDLRPMWPSSPQSESWSPWRLDGPHDTDRTRTIRVVSRDPVSVSY